MDQRKKRRMLLAILLLELLLSFVFYQVAQANGYCEESSFLRSISAELKDSCIMAAIQSMPGYWFYILIDLLILGFMVGLALFVKMKYSKNKI